MEMTAASHGTMQPCNNLDNSVSVSTPLWWIFKMRGMKLQSFIQSCIRPGCSASARKHRIALYKNDQSTHLDTCALGSMQHWSHHIRRVDHCQLNLVFIWPHNQHQHRLYLASQSTSTLSSSGHTININTVFNRPHNQRQHCLHPASQSTSTLSSSGLTININSLHPASQSTSTLSSSGLTININTVFIRPHNQHQHCLHPASQSTPTLSSSGHTININTVFIRPHNQHQHCLHPATQSTSTLSSSGHTININTVFI